jgi:RNA polymerase sigma-70 factor (ECF subfamily)
MADPRNEDGQLEQEFAQLMQRLREGSEEAAQVLFERYGPHILRVVRRKLHHKLRPQFDSIDFVQDVWASFFADRSRQATFDRPEALVRFLANMACHKVIDAFRHNVRAQKRDATRERPLEQIVDTHKARLVAQDPTPSHVAGVNEEWEQLAKRLPARYQPMLALLRQGDTHEEIARKLGLHEKTVQRMLRRIIPEPGP